MGLKHIKLFESFVDENRFNKLIDFTYLREDASIQKIEEICKIAIQNKFYSVCIRPEFVSYAYNFLEGSDVKIVTVVSFPDGEDKTQEKIVETQKSISNGADEIDMVMNWKLLKKASKETDEIKKKDILKRVYDDIAKVSEICHGADSVILKVIIESGELTLDQVKSACDMCVKAGVDFVKTSTGYKALSTIDKLKFIKSILPDYVKIKASGGIRTINDIESFVNAGADRIGTSSDPSVIAAGGKTQGIY